MSFHSGSASVSAFALGVSTVLFWAIFRGKGFLLYEAMARERDEPRRTFYIVVPFLATALGGVVANLVWGAPAALLGYLVAGVADAIAEPIGVTFGRHRYRIPSRASAGTTRSVEGSLAIFLVSICLLVGYLHYCGLSAQIALLPNLPPAALVVAAALIYTVIEALCPHGWDNALLLIVPAWTASMLLQFA